MVEIEFQPTGQTVKAEANTKILIAAIREKIAIRYGCASCRCGTCGVLVKGEGELSPLAKDEKSLLERMNLATDGSVRLACRCKAVSGKITVDLTFQESYSPDQGED